MLFGGKTGSLDDFESLYKLVSDEIEKDLDYVEEGKQRELLIKELEAFLKQIKVFVGLK